MRITVAVITRNREVSLGRLLESFCGQSQEIFELLVVDNASSDNTKHVCATYKKYLPIRYVYEEHIGIPYARNCAIRQSRGDSIVFLDDDCIASNGYVASVKAHFIRNTMSQGCVGRTVCANPEYISSAVEYVYYFRFIKRMVRSHIRSERIRSGMFVDFKNAAFRKQFLLRFQFSDSAPFGDVGDEDVECGLRMVKSGEQLWYDPSVVCSHWYSDTFSRMAVRNYWNGVANAMFSFTHTIDSALYAYTWTQWMQDIRKMQKEWGMRGYQKSHFWIVFFLFPVFSKAGRAIATLYHMRNASYMIPIRK